MVKKANGKWRMCVDFTDLNDACPIDCYPLPRIDTLIDVTAVKGILKYNMYHKDNASTNRQRQ